MPRFYGFLLKSSSSIFHLQVIQRRSRHAEVLIAGNIEAVRPEKAFLIQILLLPFLSLNFPTRLLMSCDWLDSSSLAAALSSAVAEFV